MCHTGCYLYELAINSLYGLCKVCKQPEGTRGVESRLTDKGLFTLIYSADAFLVKFIVVHVLVFFYLNARISFEFLYRVRVDTRQL